VSDGIPLLIFSAESHFASAEKQRKLIRNFVLERFEEISCGLFWDKKTSWLMNS
jgi:hypothetical protein